MAESIAFNISFILSENSTHFHSQQLKVPLHRISNSFHFTPGLHYQLLRCRTGQCYLGSYGKVPCCSNIVLSFVLITIIDLLCFSQLLSMPIFEPSFSQTHLHISLLPNHVLRESLLAASRYTVLQ